MSSAGKKVCPKCEGSGWLMRGQLLQLLRVNKGLTLAQAGEKMGYSPQFLCDIEHERREANAEIEAAYRKL